MSNIPPVNNPYAAPVSASVMRGSSDDEVVRNQYLSHEASVKSIGTLCILGGGLGLILGIFYLGTGIAAKFPPELEHLKIFMIGLGIFFLVFSALQIYAAISVRKLEGVGRIMTTVFSAIGLLGFPIGTLIGAYFLYLLWSEKGNFIFTPEYQRVVKATPHIKYKTSIVVWILLGLLLLLIVVAVASLFAFQK